jgi:hypothetical protein
MGNCYIFHVQLEDISPVIWRRLEIRSDKTFWDLHCAIQDAMPWEDRHLHQFRFPTGDEEALIGLPDPDYDDRETLPSWETRLKDWFVAVPYRCSYEYDFGDSWHHTILLEAIEPAKKGRRYPRCTAGERRCPPEDVGGAPGYERFLAALADSSHPDHAQYREWVGQTWEAEVFQPEKIKFSRPFARLRYAGLG